MTKITNDLANKVYSGVSAIPIDAKRCICDIIGTMVMPRKVVAI